MPSRAPVEFVVCRHLLGHPEDSPADIARHCDLRVTSVARAYRRVQETTQLRPRQLFHHMLGLAERPARQEVSFQLPNPAQWAKRFQGETWLSGEAAAAQDGYPIVPQRLLYYVRPEEMQAAVADALASYGRIAGGTDANLTLRVADPWLHAEEGQLLVERGQRLRDYWESKHVQLAVEFAHG